MKTKLTLDKAGRVVIPKPLRDRLGMVAGDSFELKTSGEAIVLSPLRAEVTFSKKHGVWGCSTGTPISAEMTDSVLAAIREQRDYDNFGQS